MKKIIGIILVTVLLAGCAEPLPDDRLDYAGVWQSQQMLLMIGADGSVSYKRQKGGVSTSVDGPLKEFNGDDFVVGIWFMTTTFEVTVPPWEDNGVWKMTVDGVELTRANTQ